MAEFREKSHELVRSRLRRPPKMEEVLGLSEGVQDLQYDLAGLLGGLRGTWYQVWASISTRETFAEMDLDTEHTVDLIRQEFEGMLGRPLSQAEWNTLEAHAHRNYREVMKLTLAKHTRKR